MPIISTMRAPHGLIFQVQWGEQVQMLAIHDDMISFTPEDVGRKITEMLLNCAKEARPVKVI